MNKELHILTVCQQGNCRSVGTRYRLNRRRFTNVIAIGATNTSPETLKMLSDWAEIILVAEPKYIQYFPVENQWKVDKEFFIGADKWGYFAHRELQAIIKDQLNKMGLR